MQTRESKPKSALIRFAAAIWKVNEWPFFLPGNQFTTRAHPFIKTGFGDCESFPITSNLLCLTCSDTFRQSNWPMVNEVADSNYSKEINGICIVRFRWPTFIFRANDQKNRVVWSRVTLGELSLLRIMCFPFGFIFPCTGIHEHVCYANTYGI